MLVGLITAQRAPALGGDAAEDRVRAVRIETGQIVHTATFSQRWRSVAIMSDLPIHSRPHAVAVLTVFTNHLFDWPSGGFVGVDVYFVLSGFFITGMLISERTTTRGSNTTDHGHRASRNRADLQGIRTCQRTGPTAGSLDRLGVRAVG